MKQQPVLVTDFDGTITAIDFFHLAVQRFLRPEDLLPWEQYKAGIISHFSAISRIFAKIREPEADILALLHELHPDPMLPHYATQLHDAGWRVEVASAGCAWYIDKVLDSMEVNSFIVHANPGRYMEGGPLIMEPPKESPFYSPDTGIDKAAIVRSHLDAGADVVFAGDGLPDIPAGLLVPAGRRFARADMAAALQERGEGFIPFRIWSDVAKMILLPGFLGKSGA